MKRALPWILSGVLAVVLGVVLFSRRGADNKVDGVVQDRSGRRVVAWIDPMYAQGPPHRYRSNEPGIAPDCGMRLVPQHADEQEPGQSAAVSDGISIAPARQQLIGVKLARAERRDLSRTTRTSGTVSSDERRRSTVLAKFDGYVETLFASVTGQSVRRGQPLAAIYSPDLLATQNELLLAAKDQSPFGSQLFQSARRRLMLWDMSASDIDAVVRTGRPIRAVILHSPVDGVVITKNIVSGSRILAGQQLYEIADLGVVWVLADVYQSELPYVRVGQAAQVTLPSAAGRTWSGRVSFVMPVLDPATRSVKVRVELPNSGGVLRPDMYVDVVIEEPIGSGVAVPEEAVLRTGDRSVVFVARGNGVFDPRNVQTGAHVDGFWEIRSGVRAGETVVAQANFLVDSESRLKSVIGEMNP